MPPVPSKPAISDERLRQMRALRDAICDGGAPRASVAAAPVEAIEPVERSMSFNDAMVRALVAGTKTQTRRLAAPAVHLPCRFGQPGDRLWVRERWAMAGDGRFVYAADDAKPGRRIRWRASYHMPRRASRLTLCITSVRAEKLQDISEADARAEGFAGSSGEDPREWFRKLWDGINTSPGSRWADDPWVWVIEFELVS
jgi:hypothetical protein